MNFDFLEELSVFNSKSKYVPREMYEKAQALLKRLEWTPLYFSTLKKIVYTCVLCSQSKEDGHTADCELAEAIAEE